MEMGSTIWAYETVWEIIFTNFEHTIIFEDIQENSGDKDLVRESIFIVYMDAWRDDDILQEVIPPNITGWVCEFM